MSRIRHWRWPWRRKRQPAPWEGLRAFRFRGIYYANNDKEYDEITDVIARAVSPNGGMVSVSPLPEEDEEKPG